MDAFARDKQNERKLILFSSAEFNVRRTLLPKLCVRPIHHRTDILGCVSKSKSKYICCAQPITNTCFFFAHKNESKIFSSLSAQILHIVGEREEKKKATAKTLFTENAQYYSNAIRHTHTLFLVCSREMCGFLYWLNL